MTIIDETPDLFENDYALPDGDEARSAWRINSLGEADWALSRARARALRQQGIRRLADAKIQRIQEWASAEIAKEQGSRDFFEGALKEYALRLRAEDPKRKSLNLVGGVVKTTEATGKWEVDEAMAIAWAEKNRPEFVSTKKSFTLGDAKKVFIVDKDGQVIDPVIGMAVEGVKPGAKTINASVDLDLSGDV